VKTNTAAKRPITSLDPKPVRAQQHFMQGLALHQRGELAQAQACYDQALQLQPHHFDALHLSGLISHQAKDFARALELIGQAISIEPNVAAAHNSRGIVLADLNRHGDALENYDRAIALHSGYAEAHNNRGNALRALAQYGAALESLDQAVSSNPGFSDSYVNRGLVLHDLHRYAEAVASYDAAIALSPASSAAHLNRGVSLDHLRRHEESILSYGRAIALNPADPEAYNARGNAQRALRNFTAALADYDAAIALEPRRADFYYNRAAVWDDLKEHENTLADYNAVCNLQPSYPYMWGMRLYAARRICDWRDAERQLGELIAGVERNDTVSTPFNAIAFWNSPAGQRRAAEIWIKDKHPARGDLPTLDRRPRSARIRIGYFSSDFYDHATCCLIADLFEKHDRVRFELVGFSFGPIVDDPMRRRIAAAFDEFHDVEALSDEDIALLARKLHVDIAVDLKGFTGASRIGIFAYRAAPIQVSYLGYPGTLGADYIDYIIADNVVIPERDRPHYAEKIAYLPNSYQVNDSTRTIADRKFSRAELKLPEAGFVFCCFNNNYKITPDTFDGWMRILERVSGSVLWLLEDNRWAADNLCKEAARRGIAPDRLIFSPRLPTVDHLARQVAADLFLDTLPCNAHTTASEALWVGLPVLTCIGEGFAGRVAASLLRAIGLEELITATPTEYQALACELATDPARLSRIRKKLAQNRRSAPLFNTPLFTQHIEDAYSQMYERHMGGLPPAHIFVKDS